MSYYDALGIPFTATHRDIERRYRVLAKKFHPDLHPGIDPHPMGLINEAWAVLGDPYRRVAYDRQLMERASPAGDANRGGRGRHPRGEPVTLPDLGDFGFQDWRGYVPRFPSEMRNLWAATQTPVLDALGELPRGTVWGLHLPGARFDDEDLAVLQRLEGLHLLDLADTIVTDAGLAHVAGATALEDLSVWNTRITDRGVSQLAPLRSLLNLNLGSNNITDASVDTILGLRSLSLVNVRATGITPEGLLRLGELPDLRMVAAPAFGWRERRRVAKALAPVILT